MRRLIAIAYGAILGLVAAVALAAAPSASERGVKPAAIFVAKGMTDPGARLAPARSGPGEDWAALVPVESFDPTYYPDLAEACDLADLHASSRLHGPLPPLATGSEDFPPIFARLVHGGTHARAPPADADRA
jgi:hypothetical protein